jgi:hypothetical protein
MFHLIYFRVFCPTNWPLNTCKDWVQTLEKCSFFQSMLTDQSPVKKEQVNTGQSNEVKVVIHFLFILNSLKLVTGLIP